MSNPIQSIEDDLERALQAAQVEIEPRGIDRRLKVGRLLRQLDLAATAFQRMVD
jgi:hypothetical protein